ncbi:MAG TPA: methyltransferase domain-containing protein [Solirubrobacterales bacterium]|nr:methyltransferase domain-containing protein [Solirubrobacterales bacterium]
MSDLSSQEARLGGEPAPAPPVYFDARRELAARFLSGQGLEIGPLHLPLALPPQAKAQYVDRMLSEDLRREYPELAEWDLTPVDVVDDGERLTTIAEESQDFIVANHFLEHCENPIWTIETHLGKLKPGGVLFYAVPDKRFTFDFRREVTPLEHMIADYEEGPERSRAEHFEQWTRLVIVEDESEERTISRARELEAVDYSIHFHVWTQAEFLRLVLHMRDRFGELFDIEASARQGIEFMVVLRKRGPLPPPFLPPPSLATRAKAKARRGLSKLRRR